MRATVSAMCAAFVLLTGSVHAAPVPANADDAALMQIQAFQDRSADRWIGRHHYLYDDEYQPNSETVGSVPADVRACAKEPVRIKRSDGTTTIRHFKRCD